MTFAIAGALAAILLGGTEGGAINLFGFKLPVSFDLEAWSLKEVFLLDMATYLLAIVLVCMIRYVPIAERKPDDSGLVERFKTGISYLITNRMVFVFGLASYFVFAAILVSGFYLFPMYVSGHLLAGADVYAANEMYFAIGALLAGLFIHLIFSRSNPVFGSIVLTLTASLAFISLTFHTKVEWFYFAILFLGLANAGIRILRMTFLFKVVPNSVIGRVGSTFHFMNGCLRICFLSLFALNFFHSGNNVIYAMSILGFFTLVGASILSRYYGSIRKLTTT
ncbi:MAG TPA: hypothetical protein EYO59_10615 [Chromatiaceae bacterium]|nr:hypothetical protein [Chromatiaceae bacterium]